MNQPEAQKHYGWQTYKRLLSYVYPYTLPFIVSAVGFVIFALTQASFAAWMKYIINSIETGISPDSQFLIPALLIALATARGIGTFLGTYFIAYVARKVVTDLRQQLFSILLRLPTQFFSGLSSGQLLSKLTFNVEQVTIACSKAITIMIRDGLTVIILMVYLLYLNWQLTLILLVVTPPIGLVVNKASKRFRKISKRIQSSMGDVTSAASEAIQGIPVIKIYGGETHEESQFERACEQDRRQRMKMVATTAISTPLIQIMVACAMSVLVYIGLQPKIMEGMDTGDFIAFLIAAGMIAKPLRQITDVNAMIQQGIAAAISLFDLIDTEQERDESQNRGQSVKGRLEFKDVCFTFPSTTEATLDHLSFSIEPGQTLALVGASGSGKSTTANLVPRFYDVSAGEILLDGTPISDYSLAFLRSQIAYVDQKAILFNGTLKENIAYGSLNTASEEEIQRAAEQARVLEFSANLPQGLDTPIGEQGQLLSGGQRQRICIARALLKNAPILILDEATSALDTQSEQHIQAALESAMGERTTLVIAHRLSTIERADKILVMEQGRIVESGTHKELLAKGGHYAQLHQTGFQSVDRDPDSDYDA